MSVYVYRQVLKCPYSNSLFAANTEVDKCYLLSSMGHNIYWYHYFIL